MTTYELQPHADGIANRVTVIKVTSNQRHIRHIAREDANPESISPMNRLAAAYFGNTPQPVEYLAEKRWQREDFEERLKERIEDGDLKLSKKQRRQVVAAITERDARYLADCTEGDWATVDMILNDVIGRESL